jgi:sulfate adenylyltransferase subunit 1
MHAADTLRFSTAGSVDDGKSTLIGRLLYDAHGILEDQMASLVGATRKHGHVPAGESIDFSLLTDGLIAEREQGITIDVAYRYFATPVRRFIIADTPGHEQYTRNMVTGASTADLTIILVDASRGLTMQSKRHAVIASLLRIPHVVIAINKMDCVGYDQAVFETLRAEFAPFLDALGFAQVSFVPVSALKGEMVAVRGEAMPWFAGQSLLDLLETTSAHLNASKSFRFPVQRVARAKFGEASDLRGYQGRIEAGSLRLGDALQVLPSGASTRVVEIHAGLASVTSADVGRSVTLVLAGQHDIGRGDMLIHPIDDGADADRDAPPPMQTSRFIADLCWLDASPLVVGRRYWLKHTTRLTRALVERIEHRIDVETLGLHAANALAMNEIGRVVLSVQQPLIADAYAHNRATGSIVLIDDTSNRTVAAGMIVKEATT